MKCEDCQDELIGFAHTELDEDARRAISTHLMDCGDCARSYCRLEADLGGIALAVSHRPRPEVATALRQRVSQSFAPRWWRRALDPLTRPIPAYGAILALAVGLVPVAWLALSGPELMTRERSPRPAAQAHVDQYDATRTPSRHETVL